LPASIIEIAIKALKKGGIIAFPTDTVYGLAVDAQNDEAVGKLFKLKKRPSDKAVPIMISDIADIQLVATEFPENARKLCTKYWPGALTVILEKTDTVSSVITGGINKVGIRIPDHDLVLELLREFGEPLAVTSANISGEEAITDFVQLADKFGRNLDFIIAGTVVHGRVSTVVDFTLNPPRVLREGVIKIDRELGL